MANVSNVTVGKPKVGGAVYVVKKGTSNVTLPTTASAATTGFTNLGYISEDGLTNHNTPTTETVKAWGGDTVLTLNTERQDTFKFKLLEAINVNVLKLVYGDSNVTGTLDSGIAIESNNESMNEWSVVVDMVMRDGNLKRIVIPDALVTEVSDIVYADDAAIGYEITLTALPDSDGNTHYEYIAKP